MELLHTIATSLTPRVLAVFCPSPTSPTSPQPSLPLLGSERMRSHPSSPPSRPPRRGRAGRARAGRCRWYHSGGSSPHPIRRDAWAGAWAGASGATSHGVFFCSSFGWVELLHRTRISASCSRSVIRCNSMLVLSDRGSTLHSFPLQAGPPSLLAPRTANLHKACAHKRLPSLHRMPRTLPPLGAKSSAFLPPAMIPPRRSAGNRQECWSTPVRPAGARNTKTPRHASKYIMVHR